MSPLKLLSETSDHGKSSWNGDFSDFREELGSDLPSFTATKQILLASRSDEPNLKKEHKLMSRMQRKPLLAVAVIALAMLILVPVSYAVVTKLILEVDPEQSEEEIEESLREQLGSQGVLEAEVDVEKDGDKTVIRIEGQEKLSPEDLQVNFGEKVVDENALRFAITVECELSADDKQALTETVSAKEFVELSSSRSDDSTDEAFAKTLEEYFGEHGFPSVDVTVNGGSTLVSIMAGRDR